MPISDPSVLAFYESELGRRAVKQAALAEFRCRNRKACLLLHLWRTPEGVMYYKPAYRTSRAVTAAESSEEGRAANTSDGDNHWRPDAGSMESARDWGADHVMTLQCAHSRIRVETSRLLDAADSASPGRPVRRFLPLDV